MVNKNENLMTTVKQYNESDLTLMNYKEPLTAIEDGYGFYGTLTATSDGQFIQCHLCGGLCKNLASHIRGAHKEDVQVYRDKYGLAKTTALMSESERLRSKERTVAWVKTLTEEQIEDYKNQAKEACKNNPRSKKQPAIALETMNKRGTCPDQLLAKIDECAKDIGHTPSKKEFIVYCNTQRYVHLIYKVYGSWGTALNILGMKHKVRVKGKTKDGHLYSDEELLEYLKVFTLENGVVPTQTDFYRGLLPSYRTYILHFGSIQKAREEADLYSLLGEK